MKIKITIAILAGILIICAGSLLLLNNEKNEEALRKQYMEAQLQNATDQVASNLSAKLSADTAKLKILAEFLAGEGMDGWKNGESRQWVNNLVPDLQFTELNVCKKDGTAYDLQGKERSVGFCPYYQRALLGDTTISITQIYEDNKTKSLVYTLPILKDKEIIGVLRAAMDTETVRKHLVLSLFRGQEDSYLLKRDGSIILTVDKSMPEKADFLKMIQADEAGVNELEQVIKQGRSILTISTINNETSYLCFKGIKDANDWGLMLSIPEKKLNLLFQDSDSFSKNVINFIILLITIVLSCLLVIITLRESTKSSRMESLAFYDQSTGSKNYNRFKMDAAGLLNKASIANYAIVQITIDKYDYIREFFGAQESEKLLKSISKKIGAFIKEDEVYCCANSNYFILLLKYHNKEELSDRLGYMNTKLCTAEGNEIKNDKYELRLHYGIYCLKEEDTDIDLMADRAGQALALVKGDRSQLIEYYSNEMQNKVFDEAEIEERMFTALEEKEFLVYLQPKFDLNTGRQVGAEALVRWMHPQKGLIYPGRFLGVFEKNGFIVKMDMYMLDIMCNWLKIWMSKGYRPLPLSLNVSRLNLFDENFVSNLVNTLEKYGIPPHLIDLEIAEEVVSDNMDILTALMARLKTYGFLISMDDFGTGAASMNTLYHVPIDELKLERKFLLGAEKTDRGKKVIGSIIEMAKRLNIKVVSEGVENKAQAKMLQELGCDMIQGFAFSEPLPIREYENYTYGPRAKENNIW